MAVMKKWLIKRIIPGEDVDFLSKTRKKLESGDLSPDSNFALRISHRFVHIAANILVFKI